MEFVSNYADVKRFRAKIGDAYFKILYFYIYSTWRRGLSNKKLISKNKYLKRFLRVSRFSHLFRNPSKSQKVTSLKY